MLICDYVSDFSNSVNQRDVEKLSISTFEIHCSIGEKKKCNSFTEASNGDCWNKKKRVLEAAIKSFGTDIEEYSIAAEKENSLTLLTKANSFRVTVHQKKNIVSRKNFGEIERKAQTNLRYVFMMKLWIFLLSLDSSDSCLFMSIFNPKTSCSIFAWSYKSKIFVSSKNKGLEISWW